jgi:hypothetical protein
MLLILSRNLLLVALFYACIFGAVRLSHDPAAQVRGKLGIPSLLRTAGTPDVISSTKSGVQVKFAGASTAIKVNPHANIFNRPESAVVVQDDFLGPRPHVDTEANLPLLVEVCRGSYAGIEKMRNVFDCLQYLANNESQYYTLPADASSRASAQDPRQAEYNDADGHGNTLSQYVTPSAAEPPTADSIGTCPGPIIPYHVYWTGPATWRVEVFIKSYLQTQNLACSRLWLWLDADRNPHIVDDFLHRDTLFARFLPLVDRGDIRLMAWRFPSRIPLPSSEDVIDRQGYYKTPTKPNAQGESAVADGIIEDAAGQQWLILTPRRMTFLPVAISDAVRFVVLHIHGGAYFDMDVLMLRDMRPLLLPRAHAFAERWAAHPEPGDYNTAVMSLTANSSLSSYFLRGGVRMGLNFHPRVLGRMAWKDGRDREFLMLETAAFDPIWTEFNWDREGRCTVPCLRDYGAAFKGTEGSIRDEWESWDGPQLERLDVATSRLHSGDLRKRDATATDIHEESEPQEGNQDGRSNKANGEDEKALDSKDQEPAGSFSATGDEEQELRRIGIVADYDFDQDRFPPNNRTMANFFRGSWTYHIHNQWSKHPEPSSWLHVLQTAHDGFLDGRKTNPYGEHWTGPEIAPYNYWPEYV